LVLGSCVLSRNQWYKLRPASSLSRRNPHGGRKDERCILNMRTMSYQEAVEESRKPTAIQKVGGGCLFLFFRVLAMVFL
jgi:hypothetical protein